MCGVEFKCRECGNILLSVDQVNKQKKYNLFGWTFYKNQIAKSQFCMFGKCILKCTCGKGLYNSHT